MLSTVRNLTKRLLLNRLTAPPLLNITLNLHSLSYKLAGELAILSKEDKVHPKHRIIQYEEWFLNRIEPTWTVLDIGSNTGLMANVMAARAEFVYGLEREKQLVEEAIRRNRVPNIQHIWADATTFDYSHLRKIDCITLSNVLEHIGERESLLRKLLSTVPWRDPARRRFLIRVPLITREWIAIYKKELAIEYR